MSSKENKLYFVNLSKEAVKNGAEVVCQPVEGATDNGTIVTVKDSCINCTVGSCEAFTMDMKPKFGLKKSFPYIGNKQTIVGRVFKGSPNTPISSRVK